MIKKRVSNLTPERFFFFGLVFLVCLTLLQLPVNEGEAFFSLLHPDINDTFMDFFNSVYDADYENPYTERGVIYPPLTYLFYKVWARLLCPREVADAIANECGDPMTGARFWRSTQSGSFIIVFLTLISVYILYRLLLQGQEENKTYRRNVLWILWGTVPFWYLYERGNLILQTLIFLVFFLKYYRSDNKILRELSLVALAIAVSLKIYPVVFGVLLIMDKKYREAIRCVFYGAIVFFLPFVLFGGIRTVFVMISNIMATTQGFMERGPGYKVNIDNTIAFLSEPFQIQLAPTVILIIKLLFALCMLFTLFSTRKEWQRYMVLSAVMMIFPGFSYTYTLAFAAIPLCAFLLDNPKITVRNLLFSLLFLGMFAPFPFCGAQLYNYAPKPSPVFIYPLNLTSAISSLCLLGMILLMTVDSVYSKFAWTARETTRRKDAHTVMVFGIVFFVLLAMLLCMYILYDWQYKEAYLKSDKYQVMSSIDETLSRYVEDWELIMYFSHEPFFDEIPLNHYEEIRWSECSEWPADQLLPMTEEAFQERMLPVNDELPKAFIYCTYPYPEEDADVEVKEVSDITFTLSDHLKRFVYENKYTLVGTCSVDDAYRILIYVDLQENK